MSPPNWYVLGPLIAAAWLVGFVLIWTFVCVLIANVGAWAALARQFPLTTAPPPTYLAWQSMYVGFTRYRNCLKVAATDEGLYLDVVPLFRPGHRPMLIPWSEIVSLSERKVLWATVAELMINASPAPRTLQFPPKLAERLQLAYRLEHKPPPPLPREAFT